jgi:hypothetical protein
MTDDEQKRGRLISFEIKIGSCNSHRDVGLHVWKIERKPVLYQGRSGRHKTAVGGSQQGLCTNFKLLVQIN